MSQTGPHDDQRYSRRGFLYSAVAGGGLILAADMLSSSASASTKFSQKAAHYQATPKGKARCDNCSQWQPPSSCKIIEGEISPAGWCLFYTKKA